MNTYTRDQQEENQSGASNRPLQKRGGTRVTEPQKYDLIGARPASHYEERGGGGGDMLENTSFADLKRTEIERGIGNQCSRLPRQLSAFRGIRKVCSENFDRRRAKIGVKRIICEKARHRADDCWSTKNKEDVTRAGVDGKK